MDDMQVKQVCALQRSRTIAIIGTIATHRSKASVERRILESK